MENFIYIIIGLLGLCIGSFLNVVIYRVPRDLFLSQKRSVCPHCKKQLKWFHNIPLFSYLFLKGRCGFCREKISIRYQMVEMVNTLLYLFFFWQLGL